MPSLTLKAAGAALVAIALLTSAAAPASAAPRCEIKITCWPW